MPDKLPSLLRLSGQSAALGAAGYLWSRATVTGQCARARTSLEIEPSMSRETPL